VVALDETVGDGGGGRFEQSPRACYVSGSECAKVARPVGYSGPSESIVFGSKSADLESKSDGERRQFDALKSGSHMARLVCSALSVEHV
jgi:hypothetical protein